MPFRLAGSNGQRYGETMYITEYALSSILSTVGHRHPECGGKLYCPAERENSIDLFELDPASGQDHEIFAPDTDWGNERVEFWEQHPDRHLWSGDLHSHDSYQNGFLSPKIGQAKGDLGYIEAVFEYNMELDKFFTPILTFDPDGIPVIWSWVCYRKELPDYFYAPLVVVKYREQLPRLTAKSKKNCGNGK